MLACFTLSVSGVLVWEIHSDRGTEVCVRCGAQCEVAHLAGMRLTLGPGPSPERSWAEAKIGLCQDHDWHHSGCWQSGSCVHCTMIPDGHAIWTTLRKLDDSHSAEFARRFATLSSREQFELWRFAGRMTVDSDLPDEGRTQAATIADKAGWMDLAKEWTR